MSSMIKLTTLALGAQANFYMARFYQLMAPLRITDKEQSHLWQKKSGRNSGFSFPERISMAGCSWDGSSRLHKVFKAILGALGISKADSKREI